MDLGFWPPHRPAEKWAWRGGAWSRVTWQIHALLFIRIKKTINTVMETEAFDPVHCYKQGYYAGLLCVKVKVWYVHNDNGM